MKKRIITLFAVAVSILCGCSSIHAETAVPDAGSAAQAVSAPDAGTEQETIQDIAGLQQFLVQSAAADTFRDQDYDRNRDGVWNAFDLCLMKREALPDAPGSDTLVVYFSQTGNTAHIADEIIRCTGADRYEIQAAVPYTDADIDYRNASCRANQEQNDKTARPEIGDPIPSLADYDVIYLGYPIWWGEEPRIIDTFLESYDFSHKTLIPFCTSGSSGISASEANIASLADIGDLLAGKRFSAGAGASEVEEWISSLELPKAAEAETICLTINGTRLTAALEDNSSARGLLEKLAEGEVVIDAHDYGSFEKVGSLGFTLPRNDARITTVPGDLILYQGDQFTIYYDENTWDFTKLGHVNGMTREQLKALLGDGDVTIALSLS